MSDFEQWQGGSMLLREVLWQISYKPRIPSLPLCQLQAKEQTYQELKEAHARMPGTDAAEQSSIQQVVWQNVHAERGLARRIGLDPLVTQDANTFKVLSP